MRRALPLLALLVACGTGPTEPVWLRPGTPALAAEQDYLACAARARRDFPADRRIATSPSVTIGIGSCRGNLCLDAARGVEIYDRDGAAGLRARALDVCMAAKGYAATTLPRCRGAAVQLASQPFDIAGLCVANGRIAAPR